MLHDIETYGSGMDLIKQAFQHSVLRADFRADDHNLKIVVQVFQVIHHYTPPTVYSGQGSGPGEQCKLTARPCLMVHREMIRQELRNSERYYLLYKSFRRGGDSG